MMKKFIALVLMVVAAFTVLACGSKEAVKKPDPPKPKTVEEVFYDKFESVKLGSTYDEVKKVLGEGTQDSGAAMGKAYKWTAGKAEGTIQFNGETVAVKTMGQFVNTLSVGKTITAEQASKITNGMKYEEVTKILGRQGYTISWAKLGETEVHSYMWSNEDGGKLSVWIKNGAVLNVKQDGLK